MRIRVLHYVGVYNHYVSQLIWSVDTRETSVWHTFPSLSLSSQLSAVVNGFSYQISLLNSKFYMNLLYKIEIKSQIQ